MNAIVKQKIKDIESKADIVFADKTDFGKIEGNIDSCEETVNTNIISADYVKVFRCKECRWYEVGEFVTDKNEALGYCYFHNGPWWENDYCSYGEGEI